VPRVVLLSVVVEEEVQHRLLLLLLLLPEEAVVRPSHTSSRVVVVVEEEEEDEVEAAHICQREPRRAKMESWAHMQLNFGFPRRGTVLVARATSTAASAAAERRV